MYVKSLIFSISFSFINGLNVIQGSKTKIITKEECICKCSWSPFRVNFHGLESFYVDLVQQGQYS